MQTLIGLIRTMRPKQWTKNLLFVFPAIFFDGKIFQIEPFTRVFLAFIALCMVSGTVYIINDLVDIESDRLHPRKRKRPLPSGQLPVNVAIVAALIIPVVTLIASYLFSPSLALVLVVYLGIQLLYSFRLKHIVIIDVLTVTTGFVLRVIAGVVVIEVENFSPWLYIVTGLLAFFLVVAKRRQELILLGSDAGEVRPIFQKYNLPLLEEMLRMVTTSTLIAYTLYTIEKSSDDSLRAQSLALLTVPFVLYGLLHYLYLIYVKGETSPPDEVLLKDRPLQITIVLFAVAHIVLLYTVG